MEDKIMSCKVILGIQWGDEGKAKVIDYLCHNSDYVVRYQGGSNAGHTVFFNNETIIFHLIPSGILHQDKICVIGNGVVIDPELLLEEIQYIEKKLGMSLKGRLLLSNIANLIMPYHKLLDVHQEEYLKERGSNIGTTKKGIGPCYSDKFARKGIRLVDLYKPNFRSLLETNLHEKNHILRTFFKTDTLDIESIYSKYLNYAEKLLDYVENTSYILNQALVDNKSILCEGAQGTLLDIDFGFYPYVTSSNTISGSLTTGTGIPPTKISKIYGVMKPYLTRVGSGIFPTESSIKDSKDLQFYGKEKGSTTGRLRRCGWLDIPLAKHSILLNGITDIFLTKIDVLSFLSEIPVCVGYNLKGKIFKSFSNIDILREDISKIEPVYIKIKGWKKEIRNVSKKSDMPQKALDFIYKIEDLLEMRILYVSTGMRREETIEFN